MSNDVPQVTAVPQQQVETQTQSSTETVHAQTVAQEEIVPDNVYTLSSGYRVLIKDGILDSLTQAIITQTFSKTSMDEDTGELVSADTDGDRIKLASALYNYHSALLSAVDTNFDRVVQLYDDLPSDSRWLASLRQNAIVAELHPGITFTKPEDKEFLFLRYVAFVSEDDWALLSNKVLGQNN